MSIIELNNIGETYRIKFIKEGQVSWKEFYPLRNITFNVNAGETLGVIGQNGAGKTTLLKLIAGMLIPDQGTVNVTGKVSTLMELGAGFNPEFTGRENVVINSRVYGLEEAALKEIMEQVMGFADLGDFIDAPLKYYSSGMYMRLAFALAIFVKPDILLIDDILAVGDEEAQQKCINKIFELKNSGKVIIIVSHDMNMIYKLCDNVILLANGEIIKNGKPKEVVPYYLQTLGNKEGIAVLEQELIKAVFNNGRLGIYYKNRPFTQRMDSGVGYFYGPSDILLPSYNLSWKIREAYSDSVIAEGSNDRGIVTEIWAIQVLDGRIKWRIDIKDGAAKTTYVDLFLNSKYEKWEDLYSERIFPGFSHKNNWQEIGLCGYPESTLGLTAAEESIDFPGLIISSDNQDNQIKLFNSGYDQEARIIRIDSVSNAVTVDISIYPQADKLKEYINNAKNRMLEERQKEYSKRKGSQFLSCGDLHLFPDCENKKIRLYYRQQEITGNKGLYSELRLSQDKHWTLITDAQWLIQKSSSEEIVLKISHQSLAQVYRFKRRDSHTIGVTIDLEVSNPVYIANYDVRLELLDKYNQWLTSYEEGNFGVNQYINNIGPIRLKNSKAGEVILKPDEQNNFPSLYFNNSLWPGRQSLGIYKNKLLDREDICINFSLIIPKNDECLHVGRYTYFDGSIIFDKDIDLKGSLNQSRGIELSNDNCEFIFDQGKTRLLFNGRELTVGLGLYTSVCFSGIWYDSYQAVWNMVSEEKRE